MNIVLRILLAIYAFCLAVLSAGMILAVIWPQIFVWATDYVKTEVLASVNMSIVMLVITVVFFVLSVIFLFSGFRSDKGKKSVSKKTEVGEVSISLDTIENIALNVTRRMNGIKDAKASVAKSGDGVTIKVKLVVFPEVNMPLLSEEIQQKVKKAVEDSAGVPVAEIKVAVDSIFSGASYKPRVE